MVEWSSSHPRITGVVTFKSRTWKKTIEQVVMKKPQLELTGASCNSSTFDNFVGAFLLSLPSFDNGLVTW